MRQIFVLHGYSASINDHWFLDLKSNQIEDENTTVTLIPFPDSEHPDVDAWQKVLDEQIPAVKKYLFCCPQFRGNYLATLFTKT